MPQQKSIPEGYLRASSGPVREASSRRLARPSMGLRGPTTPDLCLAIGMVVLSYVYDHAELY